MVPVYASIPLPYSTKVFPAQRQMGTMTPMTTSTTTTTGSGSSRRALFSAALAVALFTVIILCPLLSSHAAAVEQSCETTDAAIMLCMMIAVVLTEIATFGATRMVFKVKLLRTFLWVHLSSRQHNYIPPPKVRMAAFLTPLRI